MLETVKPEDFGLLMHFPASVAWSISVLLRKWKLKTESRCTAIFQTISRPNCCRWRRSTWQTNGLLQAILSTQGYLFNCPKRDLQRMWRLWWFKEFPGSCYPTAQEMVIRNSWTSFLIDLKKHGAWITSKRSANGGKVSRIGLEKSHWLLMHVASSYRRAKILRHQVEGLKISPNRYSWKENHEPLPLIGSLKEVWANPKARI